MSETMQEIVKFRMMIEERLKCKEPPLEAIPDEHRPLVAKLVHESDKTLQGLSKYVYGELLPVHEEDDEESEVISSALGIDAVEKAIKHIATRNNYGVEVADGSKAPAALSIWRWEVKDAYRDWLPKAVTEKIEARWAERRQAREDAKALFASLSQEKQSALLRSKATTRTPLKAKLPSKTEEDVIIIDGSDVEIQSPSKQSQQTTNDLEGNVTDEAQKMSRGRPKKGPDHDKAVKDKEREEKKAAKAEREKKEKEAQDKSRSIMANFFGKAKAPPTNHSASANKDGAQSIAGPSTLETEFQKTFKPFVVKKDAEVAPINWFAHPRKRSIKGKEKLEANVIVLDDFDEEPPADEDVPIGVNLGQLTAEERLRAVLSHLPPALRAPPRRLPVSHLKSYCPHSVRNIISQLNEAEIAGDDTQVRSLLSLLRDRTKIPIKALIFTEDARPGYFGTWTRTSQEVGPRTPFARDVLSLDYAYDSGEEWEEEGGDADDVVEDAEDDGPEEEGESDLDDWLVDDDDVEDPGTPIENREGSPDPFLPDLPLSPATASKRKPAEEEQAKKPKKRKVVVPLVAFTKGPCWETSIGQCSYGPFNQYRIQLFNDTPFPIDPFSFVSAPVEESAGTIVDSGFVVPALPTHLNNTSHNNGLAAPSAATKRPPLAPKTTFPDAHLPLLLKHITASNTGSLEYIVGLVWQELRDHHVKRNAVEAKVREVAEKDKSTKKWTLRPQIKAAHGLSP